MFWQLVKVITDNAKNISTAVSVGKAIKEEIEESSRRENNLTDEEKRLIAQEEKRIRPEIIHLIKLCSNKNIHITESTALSEASVDKSLLVKHLKAHDIHYDILGIYTTWTWGSNVAKYADYICNYHCEVKYGII